MAAHLSLRGLPVCLFNHTEERLEPIRLQGGIQLTCGPNAAVPEGLAELEAVSTEVGECVPGADVVMVVVPATAHEWTAAAVAPHLRDGQVILLNPGRFGGALEFRRVLREHNVRADVIVAETQTFIYQSRCEQPAQATVFRVKNAVPVAALPAHDTVPALDRLRAIYQQLVPSDHVLKTGLNNVGTTFQPAIMLLNLGRIESQHGDFEFYLEGVTPSVAQALGRLDAERLAVGEALGVRAMTAREWLYVAYDAPGRTLYEAILAQHGYKGIRAPVSALDHRFIAEDVPTGLVPLACLGAALGVPTPTIDSIVHLANVVQGCDYWQTGRNLERLGLAGKDSREILRLVLEGE